MPEDEQAQSIKTRGRGPAYILLAATLSICALVAGYLLYLKPNQLALRDFAPRCGPALAEQLAVDPELLELQADEISAALPQDRIALSLRMLYFNGRLRPVFFDGYQPLPAANTLLKRIERLRFDGIDPTSYGVDYNRERIAAIQSDARDLIDRFSLEITLWQELRLCLELGNLRDLSHEQLAARLLDRLQQADAGSAYSKPVEQVSGLDRELRALEGRAARLDVELARDLERMALQMGLPRSRLGSVLAVARNDLDAALAALDPRMLDYAGLQRAMEFYLKLDARDVIEPIEPRSRFTKLRRNSRGPLVEQLQRRLGLEEFYQGPVSGFFDLATQDAVKSYQEHHQLTPDGVAARSTFKALNVPIDMRAAQIALATQKLRETPCRWKPFYFRVNIPQYEVHVVREGELLRKHRIVVGNRKKDNNTPEFVDEIEFVEYNPFWNVPERIVEEIVAKAELAEDIDDYYKVRGYKLRESSSGRLYITQKPGAGNALGKVKILFPNHHDVYLHDTPSKYLFNRSYRAYSHGCMRLENALEMAQWLIEQDGHPEAANTERMLRSGNNRRLELRTKIPIHIEYVTVALHDDGRAIFLTDIYGRDRQRVKELLDK
ncbi:MAG: L,D-transpeptidase family protein [Candidatus Alcyoniella australis]|nr:L,D-transpeptidase family protein [Candidatus Alcyoniella australis]